MKAAAGDPHPFGQPLCGDLVKQGAETQSVTYLCDPHSRRSRRSYCRSFSRFCWPLMTLRLLS